MLIIYYETGTFQIIAGQSARHSMCEKSKPSLLNSLKAG